jgi:hypothetical protein
MFYQSKTNNESTEAIIDDNCGISKFYTIARILEDEFKINFTQQMDDAETLNWYFKYNGELLILQYNIFNGVSICPQQNKKKLKENNIAIGLAKSLGEKTY